MGAIRMPQIYAVYSGHLDWVIWGIRSIFFYFLKLFLKSLNPRPRVLNRLRSRWFRLPIWEVKAQITISKAMTAKVNSQTNLTFSLWGLLRMVSRKDIVYNPNAPNGGNPNYPNSAVMRGIRIAVFRSIRIIIISLVPGPLPLSPLPVSLAF